MNAALRTEIVKHIRKQTNSKIAKQRQWPGCPLGQLRVTGPEGDEVRAMIADGAIVLVERPKADPNYTATFACLPA